MPSYTWLTLSQALAALAARLADPGMVFWVQAELILYLQESLRTFNALTEQWNADFAFSATADVTWYPLGVMAGSPRLRTVTDAYLYTVMQYQLLEPATGAAPWTGTSQFALSDLQGALQRRRDEVIQVAGCNVWPIQLPSTPNTRRTVFADSSLEPRRARWLPAGGVPVTMNREDNLAWDGFESAHLQTSGSPGNWSVIAGPPLAMDVDVAPNIPGAYDLLSLQSGLPFAPPSATLLGVPDDFSWVAKMGALGDLLGSESEATDHLRAGYYMQRYAEALKWMKQSNWLLLATRNGVPCDTPSVRETDAFSVEWQNNASAWPSLVTAGMDLVTPCPTGPAGVSCVLVGNAPIPVNSGDFVQISRDAWDAVLDYAQFLASQKQGGAEFKDSLPLEKSFLDFCKATNKRLAKLGLFSDTLHLEGKKQDITQPR